MRTRFPKVWCAQCSTMQFAGECGHGRVEAPSGFVQFQSAGMERPSFDALRRNLVLPAIRGFRRYVVP